MISPKILIIALLMITGFSYGQKEGVFFDQRSQISKFHTISELEKLKKGDLIKLYKDRIREIVTVIPFISLTNEANIRLSDVGIKEDSDNLKSLRKGKEANMGSLKAANEMIDTLVPYADTEKIIWSILYYEEVIKKIRIGIQNSF